jgi:hypothetical protein
MSVTGPSFLTKLKWSLPWLSRYPIWRSQELLRRPFETSTPQHLIISVANHFEPSWQASNIHADLDTQLRRMEEWCKTARATGQSVRDHDGTPFRHTYFSPGEQYERRLVELVAGLEADGFGEVEIHLHHGVGKPDTSANLRRALIEFRDILASDHQCLSREPGDDRPRYAFVHGNLALANSKGGRCCGVDDEMQILAQTGCYLDMTLPAGPDEAQVPMINTIYQCGRPMHERAPHRTGHRLRVGESPLLPVILTGPLVFGWRRRHGLPFPRLEDGVMTERCPLQISRLHDWRNARITVKGRPEWVFIKLYCHGFFVNDLKATIGEPVKRFWSEVLEEADRSGQFKIHFASAREVFNIAMAAIDGHSGDPSLFRDYRLRPIRKAQQTSFVPAYPRQVEAHGL